MVSSGFLYPLVKAKVCNYSSKIAKTSFVSNHVFADSENENW